MWVCGDEGQWGTDSKPHIVAATRTARTFEDIVWEIFDETYPSGLLVLQYCVGGYSIKLAIFFLLLLLFFFIFKQ